MAFHVGNGDGDNDDDAIEVVVVNEKLGNRQRGRIENHKNKPITPLVAVIGVLPLPALVSSSPAPQQISALQSCHQIELIHNTIKYSHLLACED